MIGLTWALFLGVTRLCELSINESTENKILGELLFEKEIPSRSEITLLDLENSDGIFVVYDSIINEEIQKLVLTKFNLKGEAIWKITIDNELWNGSITTDDFNGDNIVDFILLSGIYDRFKDTVISRLSVIEGKNGKIISISQSLPSHLSHPWFLLSDKLITIKNGDYKGIIHLGITLDVRLISAKKVKIVWEKDLLTHKAYKEIVPFDVIPSPSRPVVYKTGKYQLVYITFGPYIWCLDANQGITKWTNKVENIKFFGNPIIPEYFGNSEQPTIVSGVLCEDGFGYRKVSIYSYDALSGAISWIRYLGEYHMDVVPVIKSSHYGDIPLLVIALKESGDVFILEGKRGNIIDRKTFPFLIKDFTITDVDGDSIHDIIFLSEAKWIFDDKKDAESGVIVYSIVECPLKRKLIAKDGRYELIPENLQTSADINYQLYNSFIPWLVFKNYFSFRGSFDSGNCRDIDGDGFVEMVMLSPPDDKVQKLRVWRIIPATKK